jgi:hypothetical protein
LSKNPINYTVRFILELVGLYAFGLWGWQATTNDFLRFILAIGLPLIAATIWGVFGTTGDSRGKPVIAIAGWLRLALEVAFFVLATGAFYAAGAPVAGLVFGVVALVQTLSAYDRLGWLLTHR